MFEQDSEAILKDANIDEDARTRGDQQRLQELTEESKEEGEEEPPRVPKDHTMKETAKVAIIRHIGTSPKTCPCLFAEDF